MDWKEKALEKTGEAYTTFFGSDSDKQAFAIMKDWNRLKSDMYEGKVIPKFGIPDSDKFCRSGAAIMIGQKAAKLPKEEGDALIASAKKLSENREKADTLRKGKGNNTDKDSDIEIFNKALDYGKNHPNADPYTLLSHLDMKEADFNPAYNNGYADLIKNNYKLGKSNNPVCSQEEGEAINRLVKVDQVCKDYLDVQVYMDKARGLMANDKSLSLNDALTKVEKTEALRASMSTERKKMESKLLAEKASQRAQQAQRAAYNKKQFEAAKIPDPKAPKKEKIQTPMAPTTPSVSAPVPAWQQNNGGR